MTTFFVYYITCLAIDVLFSMYLYLTTTRVALGFNGERRTLYVKPSSYFSSPLFKLTTVVLLPIALIALLLFASSKKRSVSLVNANTIDYKY